VSSHRFTVRVYYEDTDAGGVVYHASYLRFAERARTEALRDAGAPHDALHGTHGLIFVVRHLEMDYLRPTRLDSLLDIETTPVALGGASVTLRQRFCELERCLEFGEIGGKPDQTQATPIGTLTVRLVCIQQETLRPARIPDRWRHVLRPGEHGSEPARDGQTGDTSSPNVVGGASLPERG
jgi:acyl-CoA thioester hydrolase